MKRIVKPNVIRSEYFKEFKDHRSSILGNVITDLIERETELGELDEREGRGGRNYIFVKVEKYIDILNTVFSYCWDFEVLSSEIIEEWVEIQVPVDDLKLGPTKYTNIREKIQTQVLVMGRLTISIPKRISISGEVIEPITIKKSNFGGNPVTYYTDGSGIVDIGDDFKSASSDCLKKCVSMLGIYWDVKNDNSTKQSKLLTEPQLKSIETKCKKYDTNAEEICLERFNCKLEELESSNYTKLLKFIIR